MYICCQHRNDRTLHNGPRDITHTLTFLTSVSQPHPKMSSFTHYLPHLLYATALTSLGMHALAQRKAAESARAHIDAQLSLLSALATPRADGEPLDEREFERLWRLARSHGEAAAGGEVDAMAQARAGEGEGESIGWREVFLGRRRDAPAPGAGPRSTEDWDRRDLEKGACVRFRRGDDEWLMSSGLCAQIVREEIRAAS